MNEYSVTFSVIVVANAIIAAIAYSLVSAAKDAALSSKGNLEIEKMARLSTAKENNRLSDEVIKQRLAAKKAKEENESLLKDNMELSKQLEKASMDAQWYKSVLLECSEIVEDGLADDQEEVFDEEVESE